MADHTHFDHVAIAVRRWSDAYPALVEELGGAWCLGGVTETFSPGQFRFAEEMTVEVLQPGSAGENFVSRFLTERGPAAHHLTFKVRSMAEFSSACAELGYDLLPAHLDVPGRTEIFVHPRASGMGTLLQAIEEHERFSVTTPRPAEVPAPSRPALRVAWVALVVPELDRAMALFTGVLGGTVLMSGDSGRGRHVLLEWAPGRRLLLLDGGAGAALGRGDGSPGVDHVLFSEPQEPLPRLQEIAGAAPVPGSDVLGLPLLDARHGRREVPGARHSAGVEPVAR
ncbi:hypothetical protein GCM10009555_096830 [Acrocarpospora macrocephala]|uniref:VOC domain-containing protein n=1 Tax=Acrocarpospora macrocephala TaxID=150177 RepID=A0A5M3WMS8_9ACTN|nr:hypothetical protein [Acrocarpospora macrocephala]GES09372.1 hypothetical protein Amac_029680 [Acrocarpospora macrocephala]